MRNTISAPPKKAAPPLKKTIWAWTVASFFGIGFNKPGPGTWGSVAAAALWLLAASTLPAASMLPLTGAAVLLALALGVPASTIVERESGGVDPQHVVIDEVAGQWITLLAACIPGPLGHPGTDLPHALVCLGLFRMFDITKPPPARQLEALHGGLGIMLDDVAAGVYALAVALVVFHWW